MSSCPATITSTTTSYSPSLSNTTGTTTLASTNMNNKTSSAAASSAFLAMPTSRMSSNDNIIIRNQSNENKKSDAARSHSSSMTPNTSCNTDPNTNSDDENENLLLHRRSQSNELHYNLLDELRKEAEEDLQNEKLRRLARQHVDRQTTATTAATSSSSQASQVKQNNRELEEVNIGMGYRSSCDPEKEEQLLFEQRLCEDSLGVALRKINSNGKSQLRYVRCIACDEVTSVCTENRFSFAKTKFSRSRSKGNHSSFNSTNGKYDQHQDNLETQSMSLIANSLQKRTRALTWGNKNKVRIHLSQFTTVRKGKTTNRTCKNASPASHLLSLITCNKDHPSLDIEAPTRLDRDKFARAFARFLDVPLELDVSLVKDKGYVVNGGALSVDHAINDFELRNTGLNIPTPADCNRIEGKPKTRKERILSAAHTEPGLTSYRKTGPSNTTGASSLLPTIPSSGSGFDSDFFQGDQKTKQLQQMTSATNLKSTSKQNVNSKNRSLQVKKDENAAISAAAMKRIVGENNRNVIDLAPLKRSNTPQCLSPTRNKKFNSPSNIPSTKSRPSTGGKHRHHHRHIDSDGEVSSVSSLTAGFDHEVVEELHQVISELRSELEDSRAEAARAVKVAEQAIQSAESCSSKDWNSTVTHKAAEAAAQAQKRSAEAMSRQRFAEERLASERKSAAFWRRQAEITEEDAGALQTRAAVAEVQRSMLEEKLRSERRIWDRYMTDIKSEYRDEQQKFVSILSKEEINKQRLEYQMNVMSSDIIRKEEELKILRDALMERMNKRNTSTDVKRTSTSPFKRIFERKDRRKSKDGENMNSLTPLSPRPSSSIGYGSKLGSQDKALVLHSNAFRGASTLTGENVIVMEEQRLLNLYTDVTTIRHQCDFLKKMVQQEIQTSLKHYFDSWSNQCQRLLSSSHDEILCLREKLAMESNMRRRLSQEVQDLRGTVIVYCLPRPSKKLLKEKDGTVSITSREILLLHRDRSHNVSKLPTLGKNSQIPAPLSFEFDRVFSSQSTQSEVYDEMEEMVLGSLDGYNICVMTYGQRESGKNHTILGNYHDKSQTGILFLAMSQMLNISEKRSERYKDSFSMTVLEVHGDRLCDLVVGTETGMACGVTQGGVDVSIDTSAVASGKKSKRKGGDSSSHSKAASLTVKNEHHQVGIAATSVNNNTDGKSTHSTSNSKQPNGTTKLEIRTNFDGDTIVQGLISVSITNMDNMKKLWDECLEVRKQRLQDQGYSLLEYEANSHIVINIQSISRNLATGVGTIGKLVFFNLAASDLVPKRGGNSHIVHSTLANSSTSISNSNASHGSNMSSGNAASNRSAIDSILSSVLPTSYYQSHLTPSIPTEWKFVNKSLTTLCDVVLARSQYARSVPYRNSTLTHLLRDYLEGDAKVLLIACISTDSEDLQETASSLRFATKMKSIEVGKATKHTVA